MRAFQYVRAGTAEEAVRAAAGQHGAQFLAGGTTLLDLMKLGVASPPALIGIAALGTTELGEIRVTPQGLELGALVKMADAAEHPVIKRQYPVLAESLSLAASQQLRNMATLAGNVLQRTRCPYFRDPAHGACNKRQSGSGCAALGGNHRLHAVLGTTRHCIASYPGDLAQALMVLDASLSTLGPAGTRDVRFADLHDTPPASPHIETRLGPGELITAFTIPNGAHTRRSTYLKVRDRASFAFALASAAVALDLEGETVRDVRIALGGLATRPWRARAAEMVLIGRTLDERRAQLAAEAAFSGAKASAQNAFKVLLGRQVLVRALLVCKRMKGDA